MNTLFRIILVQMIIVLGGTQNSFAQAPAFPTAEGYGKWAKGGRGGKIVEVTNLNDDANGNIEGSLRWALKQHPSEPFTVIFKVSGMINLVSDLRLKHSHGFTIAGQTAPGDGICIRGAKCNFGGSSNFVIRHLRFRIGLKELTDSTTAFIAGGSIGIENANNWIIDHCTFGWSGEENMTIYDNKLTTVQWCLVHEGLYDSGHGKGARSYGAQWGGQTSTYHHNLLANNVSRTPRVNGARSNDINVLMDYVNNVNYNWGKENSCYGSDMDASGKTHKLNMINNYYKPGPARPGSSASYFTQASFHSEQTTAKIARFYMKGNYMEGSANSVINTDNTLGLDASAYIAKGIAKTALISDIQFEVPYQLKIESAQSAYENVLNSAGAFPRDTVDRRIIHEVRTGTVTYGGRYNNYTKTGIIDSPFEAGGYPEYKTYNPVTDNDHDGMDDAWELSNGLDPNNPEDRNKMVKSGFTCLEVYLNSLVDEKIELDFTLSEKKVHHIVVAKDGSGDFSSINEAIAAAPDKGARTTIFIKKGLYKEKVFIGDRWVTSNKIISLIGEHVDSVVIVWDDYNGKTITYPGKTGTITADGMTCPTMTVTSPDFYMENITVKNPSTEAQAVALYQAGDRQVLKNCKIIGNQDTHRTKKGRRYFYYKCTIEGGVDFIYAGGTCYFYQCDIVSNRDGYITAPEDITYKATLAPGKTLRYGFFFKDCTLSAKDGVANGSVYLGRPWGPECGSVYLNCRLGNHINNKGWTIMGSGNEKTACFGEYKSMNFDGSALVNVSERINWSMQFNTDEVNNFMLLSKIYSSVSSTVFDPVPMVVAPPAPKSLSANEGYLTWLPVEQAIGYVIYANGSAIGFNTAAHYNDTLQYNKTPVYTVRAIGSIGNLSVENGKTDGANANTINQAINSVILGKTEFKSELNRMPKIENGIMTFANPVSFSIYTTQGQHVMSGEKQSHCDLHSLPRGIYLLRASEGKNNLVLKFML